MVPMPCPFPTPSPSTRWFARWPRQALLSAEFAGLTGDHPGLPSAGYDRRLGYGPTPSPEFPEIVATDNLVIYIGRLNPILSQGDFSGRDTRAVERIGVGA